MKKLLFIIFLSSVFCIKLLYSQNGDSQYQPYAPDGIPFVISDTPWIADGQGNHRAVVSVKTLTKQKAVVVNLPWRRPDLRPESKKVIVVNAESNREIKNVMITQFSSESAVIIFEPDKAEALYYIYYLPYRFRKGWDDARYGEPWNDYLPPVYDADIEWLDSLPKDKSSLTFARLLRFESRTKFDFFTPMGSIATDREMNLLKHRHKQNPLIFTEDRAFPIRLTHQIPVRWVKNGISDFFKGEAMRNEYYVWQIGLWAAHGTLEGVSVRFSDLVHTEKNVRISKEEITCFNQEGVDWNGKSVKFIVNVPKGKVQALWCGVQVPENILPGKYKGTAVLTASGIIPREIKIEINVNQEILNDKGDGDLWRHARLRWLNSRIGENNLPVYPYKTMSVSKNKIIATDKSVLINESGFLKSIQLNGKEVLSEPLKFSVEVDNQIIEFDARNLIIQQNDDGLVSWKSSVSKQGISFHSSACMEYDGYIRYNFKVSSSVPIKVKNIKFTTHYTPYASLYFMGAGFKGGFRPHSHSWYWQGPWDSYWMGNDKAGLHVEFRGASYNGPLLNDYKPEPPTNWANGGRGSISVSEGKEKEAIVIAQTGEMQLSSEEKDFEFAFLITPVKPINPHYSPKSCII